MSRTPTPIATLTSTDGRRARGERARTALIAATLAIIERDGIAGVSHRAVTREAGMPATSAAYHFATINDLLEASLLDADARAAAALVACRGAEDPIRALAELITDSAGRERTRCIAEYELFLYAARVPAMRPVAQRWIINLSALVDPWTDDSAITRAICSYVDGLMLQALVSGETPDADAVAATISRLAGR